MYKADDVVVNRRGDVVHLEENDSDYFPLRYETGRRYASVTLEGVYDVIRKTEYDIIRHATEEEKARFLGKTWIPNVGEISSGKVIERFALTPNTSDSLLKAQHNHKQLRRIVMLETTYFENLSNFIKRNFRDTETVVSNQEQAAKLLLDLWRHPDAITYEQWNDDGMKDEGYEIIDSDGVHQHFITATAPDGIFWSLLPVIRMGRSKNILDYVGGLGNLRKIIRIYKGHKGSVTLPAIPPYPPAFSAAPPITSGVSAIASLPTSEDAEQYYVIAEGMAATGECFDNFADAKENAETLVEEYETTACVLRVIAECKCVKKAEWYE